jgi:hypothetical protein
MKGISRIDQGINDLDWHRGRYRFRILTGLMVVMDNRGLNQYLRVNTQKYDKITSTKRFRISAFIQSRAILQNAVYEIVTGLAC